VELAVMVVQEAAQEAETQIILQELQTKDMVVDFQNIMVMDFMAVVAAEVLVLWVKMLLVVHL
jgi:hypothetical protein